MKFGLKDPFQVNTFSDQVHALGGFTKTLSGVTLKPEEILSNTSIYNFKNTIFVAQRLLWVKSGSVTYNWRQNSSSILLSQLDGDSGVKKLIEIHPESFEDLESLEDPRLSSNNSKLEVWVAGCKFSGKQTSIRQLVIQLEDDFSVSSCEFPPFGRNLGVGYEKNWCPIPESNLFVYQCGGEFIINNKISKDSWISRGVVWPFGDIHCGSTPILIDGKYFMFYHSSLKLEFKESEKGYSPRQYYVGALMFSSTPPYEVLAITEQPLFFGSFNNKVVNGSPAAVFVTGSVLLSNLSLMFSLGLNDCESHVAEVPVENLLNKMVKFR